MPEDAAAQTGNSGKRVWQSIAALNLCSVVAAVCWNCLQVLARQPGLAAVLC
jgi:hypothetical protein